MLEFERVFRSPLGRGVQGETAESVEHQRAAVLGTCLWEGFQTFGELRLVQELVVYEPLQQGEHCFWLFLRVSVQLDGFGRLSHYGELPAFASYGYPQSVYIAADTDLA